MFFTQKQMENEVAKRLHEENLRRMVDEEIMNLHKRISMLEDRVDRLERRKTHVAVDDPFSDSLLGGEVVMRHGTD